MHKFAGMEDPTEHSLVVNMVEAARRICSSTVRKKEPIEAVHIAKLYELLVTQNYSLTNFRTFVMIVLAFTGFLRYEEVAGIRRGDIEINTNYAKIFMERSKTDVYRDGH